MRAGKVTTSYVALLLAARKKKQQEEKEEEKNGISAKKNCYTWSELEMWGKSGNNFVSTTFIRDKHSRLLSGVLAVAVK